VPLPRYGVAIGTFVSFARDPQDQYGHWYHGHLTIDTPEGQFQSALDVDAPSGVGVSYRISRSLAKADLGVVASLPNGWHALSSDTSSGALDYLRSPMFRDGVWRLPLPQIAIPVKRPPIPDPGPLAGETVVHSETAGAEPAAGETIKASAETAANASRGIAYQSLPTIVRRSLEVAIPLFPVLRPWIPSTGDNALTALETQLPNASRIYLFGDHYETGLGVHDVHMNQGDPSGSQWWASDGIWQDGAVCLERANGTIFAWQVKFNSQSFKTDSSGHPS
jgi:Uncharacterized conserved protein (DUF2278)